MARKRASNDPSIRVELTGRQREVLAMIERGATNGEIAERLGLSLEGAKWHVREIFGRLGVDSREEAVERWREVRPRAWVPFAASLFGVSAAVAVAVVVVSIVLARTGGSAPKTIPELVAPDDAAPASLRIDVTEFVPQPPLQEVAAGNGWRLLLADDGLSMPPATDRVLAVGYSQQPPRVDVLGMDGRIAARVEGGYALMARLNPINGDLLVSDWVEASVRSPRHARALVFDLDTARLKAEIPFSQKRVDFTVPGNAIFPSADGSWLYWVEHGTVCPSGGDEAVCDLAVFHAVDLRTMSNSDFAAAMPIGCGIPWIVDGRGSSLTAVCLPRVGSSQWQIDAERGPHDGAVEVAAKGVNLNWWAAMRFDDVALDLDYTNDGTLTRLRLLNFHSGDILAEWPLESAWSALLLDERTALLMRSDGRLDKVNLLDGSEVSLPYKIPPGWQGLDIRFYR